MISAAMRSMIYLVCDTVLFIFCFYHIPSERKWHWHRCLLLFSALLCLFTAYFLPICSPTHSFGATSWVQYLSSALAYVMILILWKRMELSRALYFSSFFLIIHTSCQGLILSPFFYRLANILLLPHNVPTAYMLSWIAIRCLIHTLIFCLVAYWTPLAQIQEISLAEWFVTFLVLLCEIYIRQTLPTTYTSNSFLTLAVFSFLLQILILAFYIFFIRYGYVQQKQKELQMQGIANHYQMESVKVLQTSQTNLRALHHDMKNHLLTIRQLASAEENHQIHAYIGDLLEDISEFETVIQTGNTVLNGLISEKMALATTLHTDLVVLLDFSQITFLNDKDICTLFGNSLDNALEACAKLPSGIPRHIILRSKLVAGQLHISITNNCLESIQFLHGLPKTTKKNAQAHGIGLRNIRHTLEKYNGILSINTDTPGTFVLSMLIPLPLTPSHPPGR